MAFCVLLVEDNDDLRILYTFMLKTRGFEVTAVSDGHQALEALLLRTPDLLITDVGLPNLDGLSLIKQIRDMEPFAQLPIIAMTGNARGYLTWALAAGANEVIAKPFDAEDLFLAIFHVLPTAGES